MNPSRLFILRPVATTLFMLAILLVGMVSYLNLPVSALPSVDYPTIQIQTFYPGASPEVMTSAVTAPLERQFGQLANLNQMTSQSSAGASVITLQFSLDLSLDIAEQQVQAAINAAGIPMLSSCRQGICGTCEADVLDGIPDHRDSLLTDAERAANSCMFVCVSSSRSDQLVLDL